MIGQPAPRERVERPEPAAAVIELLTSCCETCRDWPVIGTPDQPGRAECRCRATA